jgi:hypothetical protein
LELPFRENLSEGSVLFIEYFLSTTAGGVQGAAGASELAGI